MKTIPKDMLSIDVENNRHIYKHGEWKYVDGMKTKIDICKSCGCERRQVKVYNNYAGRMETIVSGYTRSNIYYEAAPPCWNQKNPK